MIWSGLLVVGRGGGGGVTGAADFGANIVYRSVKLVWGQIGFYFEIIQSRLWWVPPLLEEIQRVHSNTPL